MEKNKEAQTNVIYRITYASEDRRLSYTHIVHTLRDCLAISRAAKERGFKPKREKIRTTLDMHIITTII